MLVLHLSDLHLSRYGETGTWTSRDQRDADDWEVLNSWKRWHVEGCRDRKGRPDDLRLVDPQGVVHKVRNWPARGDDKVISALLAVAMERHRTSSERLVQDPPTGADLDAMLQVDPGNTNLRFLRLMEQVRELAPRAILLTGDITDNGFGYGLVRHYMRPWIERDRMFAVPGNHDTYDMFPRVGRGKRTAAKIDNYAAFAAGVGLEAGEAGTYIRLLGDVAVVGLNSCKMPLTPLSASGAVSDQQLDWLETLGEDSDFAGCRLRLALLHHHLLHMPFTVGKRSPIEAGMRLRNAVETMQALSRAGFDMAFHGHRHHGYVVKLPGRPTVVASPSSTLGCKSADREYAWVMDLSEEAPWPRVHDLDLQPRSNEG
jgi:3',5'-cyclic AMP phosphodiesterase CpdA